MPGLKLFFLLWLISVTTLGQDSLVLDKESSKVEAKGDTIVVEPKTHPPRRALLLSAVIPGAGQIYNKKYWKAPLIWGGFVALAFSLDFNLFAYREFRDAYIFRTDGDSTTNDTKYNLSLPDDEQVLSFTKLFRRKVDLTFVGFTLLYAANIIDAYVDAHLFDFDVGEDIHVHWNPSFYDLSSRSFGAGIHLQLKL